MARWVGGCMGLMPTSDRDAAMDRWGLYRCMQEREESTLVCAAVRQVLAIRAYTNWFPLEAER
jgi:hypothetical protein